MKMQLLGAAAAFLTASMADAATIVNGGFEQSYSTGNNFDTLQAGNPALGGWAVKSGSVDLIHTYWMASGGNNSLDLAGLSEGAIEQVVETEAGQAYSVSFDMAANPDGGPLPRLLAVSAAGRSATYTYNSINSKTAMNWITQQFDFTADGSSTTLRFAALNGDFWGAALDNVAIAEMSKVAAPAVPEPATWTIMLLGFGGLGYVMRRRHGPKVRIRLA